MSIRIPAAARESVAGLAAVFAGALGAFTLMPVASGNLAFIDVTGPFGWTAFDMTAWNSLQANTIVVGAAVAAPVCALLAYAGSRRNAWAVVAACALLIGILAVATPTGAGFDATVCYYIRALAAGVLLGGAVAAAWGRQIAQTSLVFGFVATWLIVWLRDVDDISYVPTPSMYQGNAPWWLVVPTVVAAGAAAATARAGFRAARPTVAVVRLAVAGAIGYVVLNRVLGAWILHSDGSTRSTAWTVAVAATVVIVAAVALITYFAPGAEARFVLVLVAVTAAATPVVQAIPLELYSTVTLSGAFVVGLLATMIGLRAAGIRPDPLAGLAVVAVVPLLAVLWPDFGNDSWIILRVALLGLGAGHAIGSNLADESSFAAAGLVVPPASYAITMLYAVNRFSPLPSPTAPEPSKSGAYYTDIVIVRDDLRWASLPMLAIVVCCMVSVFLRSRRPKRGE